MTTQQHKEILGAIAVLGEGIQELRADNATLHADNATIHADNATLHGELRELRESIGQLDVKLDQTRNHLSAQIDRVHQELSGRIGDLERSGPRPVPRPRRA